MLLSAFAAYRHHEPKSGTCSEPSPASFNDDMNILDSGVPLFDAEGFTREAKLLVEDRDECEKNVSQKRQRWEARRKEGLTGVLLAAKGKKGENKAHLSNVELKQLDEENKLQFYQMLDQLSKRHKIETKVRIKSEKVSITKPRCGRNFSGISRPIHQPRKNC